jgi:hypothetical protein
MQRVTDLYSAELRDALMALFKDILNLSRKTPGQYLQQFTTASFQILNYSLSITAK